jgi:hypothetical protein
MPDSTSLPRLSDWPSASCCGEPRVSKSVDRCYDCADVCTTCGGPAAGKFCPACSWAGSPQGGVEVGYDAS